MKSPNWLYGSKCQDLPASFDPSAALCSAPQNYENELEQELVGMDWSSEYGPVAEEELYDRYGTYIT